MNWFRVLITCLILLNFMPPAWSVTAFKRPATSLSQQASHKKQIIILIHGLLRTYLSMSPLKFYLSKQGYEVYYYKYISARYSIHEHSVDLESYVRQMVAEHPGVRIHFVTHSLGGIIIREALSQWSKEQLKNIGVVIMLAPPNQGSPMAKWSLKVLPILTYFIKPLNELSSDSQAYVHQVPIPPIKIGIIAARFDGKVPMESTKLKGFPDPAIVNATHTFIMNHAKTKALIKTFLEKGYFE